MVARNPFVFKAEYKFICRIEEIAKSLEPDVMILLSISALKLCNAFLACSVKDVLDRRYWLVYRFI